LRADSYICQSRLFQELLRPLNSCDSALDGYILLSLDSNFSFVF
jgi:hypothetical protein